MSAELTFFGLCRLVSELEDFCSSGEFTGLISDFAGNHASKFRYDNEEQSMECY